MGLSFFKLSRVIALFVAGASRVFLTCFGVHYWYLGHFISYAVVGSVLLGAAVTYHLLVTNPLAARRDALQRTMIRLREGTSLLSCPSVIGEVPVVILRCIIRDEATLAVAQKVFKGLYENAANTAHVGAHLAMLASICDARKLVVFLKARTGVVVSNEEILGFAKLFNDELTLDNNSRPRLVHMCKHIGIQPYATVDFRGELLVGPSRNPTLSNDVSGSEETDDLEFTTADYYRILATKKEGGCNTPMYFRVDNCTTKLKIIRVHARVLRVLGTKSVPLTFMTPLAYKVVFWIVDLLFINYHE
ncbi:unnamed protein product [Lactuca virosa]|uniref:Uncharacterized protein n=1 Tax=Lactuca virosa TaxID=75947 RepID=A0AAU9PP41_9ASTR|nr:unnamed protein product [Lactuca virosa]